MTETVKNRLSKALDQAKDRREKTHKTLRRNRLAYMGLHVMAYEQFRERTAQLRTARKDLFMDFLEKGEDMEAKASELLKGVKGKAEDLKDKAEDIADDVSQAAWNLTPGAKVNRVEAMEAEFKAAKAELDKLAKAAKPAPAKPAKKAKAKPVKAETGTVKTAIKAKAAKTVAAKSVTDTAKAADTKTGKAAPAAPAKPAPKPAPAAKAEPRHIPYFNDVKRYDPLANEEIVRKIVNHCGIALQSADARNVACSDESERNRVRDSWMKKKLGLTASDADLDKKVLNICAVMQRDNHKNRVTFYYLIAKAERKLGDL